MEISNKSQKIFSIAKTAIIYSCAIICASLAFLFLIGFIFGEKPEKKPEDDKLITAESLLKACPMPKFNFKDKAHLETHKDI